MHELSVTQHIVEIIIDTCQNNSIASVKKIFIEIGLLTTYEAEAIKYYFNLIKKNYTEIRDAIIVIKKKKVKYKCKRCHNKNMVEDLSALICHRCGSSELEIIEGDKIKITKLEV